MILKLFLVIAYGTLPAIWLAITHKFIYQEKNKYGVHIQYISKYLISFSFLPVLLLHDVEFGLVPTSFRSVIFIILTSFLAIAGVKRAMKGMNLFFYNAGIIASFMEEIIYRGVIFGLSMSIWNNQWTALVVSSFLFGVWHLKNIPWCGVKNSINQFFQTALFFGPIFGLMRIFTGDIYLSVLFHFIVNSTCALAPNCMRGWLVKGGKGKPYDDVYAGIK